MISEKATLPNGKIEGEPLTGAGELLTPDGPPENPFNLKEKELTIVAGILSGKTKKDCAISVGYKGKSPTRWAATILKRPHVQRELQRRTIHEGTKIAYDPNRVLHCLVMVAEANIIDALVVGTKRTKITLANLHRLPENLKYSIKSVKFAKDGTVTIEIHDKLRALRMIGEFFKMWSAERGAEGDKGTIIEETMVYERRIDEIGELIRARLDRRVVHGAEAPPTIGSSID